MCDIFISRVTIELRQLTVIGKLKEIEKQLPSLLSSVNEWNSVYINYEKPFVERLWRQIGEDRLYLHKIYPCKRDEAFFHPHPWKSAIKIISGTYEMGVGNSGSRSDITIRLILTAGSYYEMLSLHDWHYVCPIEHPSYSIMVSGKPLNHNAKPERPGLKPLSNNVKNNLLEFFRKKHGKYDTVEQLK